MRAKKTKAKTKRPVTRAEFVLKVKIAMACGLAERYRNMYAESEVADYYGSELKEKQAYERIVKANRLPWEKK